MPRLRGVLLEALEVLLSVIPVGLILLEVLPSALP